MHQLATLGRFGLFLGQFVRSTLTHPPPVARTLEESYRVGVQSLPILLIVSVFVGTNLSFQGYNAFRPLGADGMVGLFVALAGVREMAPIMVASMVAAKAGTEMASQIAVMRIQEQIDALELMGVDPYWYLITPRYFGILAMLPPLSMICIATTIVAAYLVATLQLGLSGPQFMAQIAAATTMGDLMSCSIKALVFGNVISLVSCYAGFHSESGAKGVGEATNSAVVLSAVICAMLNYVLSELLFT